MEHHNLKAKNKKNFGRKHIHKVAKLIILIYNHLQNNGNSSCFLRSV